MATEGALAPQYATTQHALGMIVGRLHVVLNHEQPKRLAQIQQVLAVLRDGCVRAGAAALQKAIEPSSHRQQTVLQLLPRTAAAAEVVPGFENRFDNRQASLADRFARTATVDAFLK